MHNEDERVLKGITHYHVLSLYYPRVVAIWSGSPIDFGIFSCYNDPLVKKKVTLISLFSAIIILGYLSFTSWLLGFITAKFLGAKADGKRSKLKSIIIPLGKYKLHLASLVYLFGSRHFGDDKRCLFSIPRNVLWIFRWLSFPRYLLLQRLVQNC